MLEKEVHLERSLLLAEQQCFQEWFPILGNRFSCEQ